MTEELELHEEEIQKVFKFTEMVSVDGYTKEAVVKATVNYEKLTYSVSCKQNGSNGWGASVRDAYAKLFNQAHARAMAELVDYRERTGIGTQGSLFDGDNQPTEAALN